MSWLGIEGHDAIVERLTRAIAQSRLGSTYLFAGPSGIGKRTFALQFARGLLCESANEFQPCGSCASCKLFDAQSHPDLEVVQRDPEKATIHLKQLVGDREHRMQEGLCHWISLRPMKAPRKVAILVDADDLNPEGANALLKTLEEPPADSMLILISHNLQRQLPTIRSRCQILHFHPLSKQILRGLLIAQEIATEETADQLADWSDGSLDTARELADPAWQDFHQQLVNSLSREAFDFLALGKDITSFVDQAGSEAALRRARLRQVIRMSSNYYLQVLRAVSGGVSASTSVAVQRHAERINGDAEPCLRRLDHCQTALEHVDANAHTATLVDAWLGAIA